MIHSHRRRLVHLSRNNGSVWQRWWPWICSISHPYSVFPLVILLYCILSWLFSCPILLQAPLCRSQQLQCRKKKKPPHVPPYCNLCNNLWLIISQACIPPPWHPQHGLHCSTYSGTLNPSDRINSAALLRIPWISRHPRVQLGHWCHSLKPKRESEHCKHCFYLDFFDIRGGDVAGFPRAAVGPQPPVFVAPLQD